MLLLVLRQISTFVVVFATAILLNWKVLELEILVHDSFISSCAFLRLTRCNTMVILLLVS